MKATIIKKGGPDDPKKGAVRHGSDAVLIRNKQGTIEKTMGPDYGGVTTENLREDRLRTHSGNFLSGEAPRVGGKATATQGGVPMGGTKKQIFKAKMRVNRSSASPQAKRSARAALRK